MSAQCPQPSDDPAASNHFAALAHIKRKPRRTDAPRLPLVWAGKSNTREGELYRRTVRQLRQHLGAPSQAQELLIGRIAWLSVHLARMDRRILESGEMSEHTGKQYLAWSGAVCRGLQALGMEAAPRPRRTLADHLAEKAAASRASAAQEGATAPPRQSAAPSAAPAQRHATAGREA